MRITSLVLCFVFLISSGKYSSAQDKTRSSDKANATEQIRKYWFVMLLKGPNRTQDSITGASIQKEHLANIGRLYNEGKLKVAGPFGDNGNWLGIFIFDCETKEEVERLLKTDAAISSGRLAYDIRPWHTAPMGSFAPGRPKNSSN